MMLVKRLHHSVVIARPRRTLSLFGTYFSMHAGEKKRKESRYPIAH